MRHGAGGAGRVERRVDSQCLRPRRPRRVTRVDLHAQWEADIAVHFARAERYAHRAIEQASAVIAVARPQVAREIEKARHAEQQRGVYRRQRTGVKKGA